MALNQIKSSRRAFIHQGSLVMLGAFTAGKTLNAISAAADAAEHPALQIGLITDLHYAEKPPGKTRYYQESLLKVREGVGCFNHQKLPVAIALGDLIDSGDTVEVEIGYLKKINAELAQFSGDRHYVLGNHDAWSLTKDEFLQTVGAKKTFYSFDQGVFHFVILDACYRADGVSYGRQNFKWNDADLPPAQHDWLRADLAQTAKPTIVFVHQRLDVKPNYSAKSAPAVRKILENSKKVLAVFQGHSHKNDYQAIKGIHYCTLRAVVEGSGPENNGYAVLSVFPDGTLRVNGFRRQNPYSLTRTA